MRNTAACQAYELQPYEAVQGDSLRSRGKMINGSSQHSPFLEWSMLQGKIIIGLTTSVLGSPDTSLQVFCSFFLEDSHWYDLRSESLVSTNLSNASTKAAFTNYGQSCLLISTQYLDDSPSTVGNRKTRYLVPLTGLTLSIFGCSGYRNTARFQLGNPFASVSIEEPTLKFSRLME